MIIKNHLWIIPFFSFFIGYYTMQCIFPIQENIVPHLIGKHVHEILPLITQYNLNIRLLDTKEEAALPPGIILNQTPTSGTTIKQNQPLFIVTTKKPIPVQTSSYVGMNINDLDNLLKTTNINHTIYYLSHPYPENVCFAQSPQPGEPLNNNKLILYISSGNNKPIIWPNFIGISLHNVLEFLNNYHIKADIINDSLHQSDNEEYIIKDQRPFAGTLLLLDERKPLSVQLRIEQKRIS